MKISLMSRSYIESKVDGWCCYSWIFGVCFFIASTMLGNSEIRSSELKLEELDLSYDFEVDCHI